MRVNYPFWIVGSFFLVFSQEKNSMHKDNIILISLTKDELIDLFRGVLREEHNYKNEKKLLNTKEVCKFLDCHISTLNKWKAEGIIPFKRLGKRVYFDKEEIIKAMKDDKDKRFDVHSNNDI